MDIIAVTAAGCVLLSDLSSYIEISVAINLGTAIWTGYYENLKNDTVNFFEGWSTDNGETLDKISAIHKQTIFIKTENTIRENVTEPIQVIIKLAKLTQYSFAVSGLFLLAYPAFNNSHYVSNSFAIIICILFLAPAILFRLIISKFYSSKKQLILSGLESEINAIKTIESIGQSGDNETPF